MTFSSNFQTRRSAMEYLTFSRFYFEVDGMVELLIAKASGVKIGIETSDATAPIGSTRGGSAGARTQTQGTPTGVKTDNITLEFVSTDLNTPLLDWYLRCHPKSRDGGPRNQMEQRFACSLVFYKQNGDEGARWNIRDAIPAKYKSSKLTADGKELFKETVEIAHAGLIRANI